MSSFGISTYIIMQTLVSSQYRRYTLYVQMT